MANMHMKRCSPLLVIRVMQVKTTVRYHFTLLGWLRSKRTDNNKHWQGHGKIETFIHCWLEYEMVQPFGKTVWQFLKELNTELTYNPENNS